MKFKYRLIVNSNLELISLPQKKHVKNVEIVWERDQQAQVSVDFTVSGIPVEYLSTGEINVYSHIAMANVFSAASFLSASIMIQTGVDAFRPLDVVGNSPTELIGETLQEEQKLRQNIHRKQRSILASMPLSCAYNPDNALDDALSVPIVHFADALRTSDPLDKYKKLYKVLEFYSCKGKNSTPLGPKFDKALSSIPALAGTIFEKQETVERYRLLRKRIEHVDTGKEHISPDDIDGIMEVQKMIPEVERLVRMLIGQPNP